MDGHHHSDFGGGSGGCDSFQQTTHSGGFDSHHSSHGGGFDNHSFGGFGGCDTFQQTTHHRGGFDHHHSHHHHHGHHHGGSDPIQQDINLGGSVQYLHHYHHGGTDHTHHHIHNGGQQHFSDQPIAVVDRTYPYGIPRSQFKRHMTIGVILLVISLGLIIAGAATIAFLSFLGIPLLVIGGVLLIAGIVLTSTGCTSYNKYRSQHVTSGTVVMQPSSTVYITPPYIISTGNTTNTSAPYHQGFSTSEAPPPYS